MQRKLVLIAIECVVVFVLVPLLALYKARHDSGHPCMFKEKDESKAADVCELVDDESDEPSVKQGLDLSNYTDEELMRIMDGVEEEPEDPDAELKRRFAYVAERSDDANERRMAQNAVNWLASNKSASLGNDGAEELRGYADQMFVGTKERTNDFTKEERRQRYADRYEQAKQLSDMAQFIIDENGDDERYQRDTRQARNVQNFLINHTSKFDAMGDADVAELTRRVGEMYDAAAGRRGFARKTLDRLFSWADGFFKVERESQARWHHRRTNK